jgi:cephalosporin-C deacetylase-like acetyl esterase
MKNFNRILSISLVIYLIMPFCVLAQVNTFTPYKINKVPNNVSDLWKDYDPSQEKLDVKVIKEWKADGITTRYITFKVGTFKGANSRIAAYYSFPDNGQKNPAFVWSHGGGQRAERNRGIYFAKQGYATVDINWLGRPMEKIFQSILIGGKSTLLKVRGFIPKLREMVEDEPLSR